MKIFKRCFRIKGFAFLFFSYLIATAFAIATISGCALFRKKNKCNDCPKWSHEKEKNESDYLRSIKKPFKVAP